MIRLGASEGSAMNTAQPLSDVKQALLAFLLI
jgi:hypothetical protein